MKMEVCEGEVTLRLDKYSIRMAYEVKYNIKDKFHN